MGSSSATIFSFHSLSPLANSTIQAQNRLKTPSINPTHIRNSPFLHPKLQISGLHSHYDPLLRKPPSNNSHITYFFPPWREIPKLVSEKIVVLLIGSFIFMGYLNPRPVLAQPINQESSQSENFEQKEESKEGNYYGDEEMYMKLLEENPRNVEALKVVFYGKMKRGETKEAVKYVERLIDVEPNDVEWRLLQALCYDMMGQLSKAKSLFKKILRQRPLLVRALHGLAMLMHKNFEGPAVFEMLNGALETARREKRVVEERNIRILIAQMHVVKGELENALKLFQDLIDENPRDFRPYLCQGIVYGLLDRKDEAEKQFVIYRSLVPEEFPQRGFLDDVVLAAKMESKATV